MTTVGQFTVDPTAGVQAAAAQIATSTQSDSQSAGLVPAMRTATVVSNDGGTPPTCTVTFDGTTNVAGIRYVTSWTPAVADVVNCFVLNGVTWITEKIRTALDPAPPDPTPEPGWDMQVSNGLAIGNLSDVTLSGSVLEETDVTDDSGGTFTVGTSGRYIVTLSIEFDHGTSTQAGYRLGTIGQQRSGSDVALAVGICIVPPTLGDQYNPNVTVSKIFRAEANDTFFSRGRQNSGTTLHIRSSLPNGYSSFTGQWIGP